ncbi:DMT family transporter [Lysinibacillus sp. fls2-241-R2A-57]|uniref:DMT family transporter n=1 Tax=Lysinibacillus sp. fls2-241-R2A-57 TaxID=3040292 RepID=UPI0025577370|nr:DMT family transporter [Lysinibacillus sp. fls2-241-R2A-57]
MSNAHYIKGLWLGLFGGILWGVDTVFIGLLLDQPLLDSSIFFAPLVITFLHDSFSSLWILVYIIKQKYLSDLKNIIHNKTSLVIILAAFFGGPLGMAGYMMAIYYIGPSYTAIISATYPAVGAFLSVLFLKEKLTFKTGVGLSITIFSTMALGFTSSESNTNLILGFFFAALCAIGWGAESVISAYGMRDNIIPVIALYLRQTTSAVIFALIIIPLIDGYEIVKLIFSNSLVLYIFITALAGTVSYLFYYTSINSIGPIKATGLNISYSAWAILISLFLGFSVSLRELVLACIIISGSLLTTNRPQDFFQLLKFNRKVL